MELEKEWSDSLIKNYKTITSLLFIISLVNGIVQ